MKTEDYEKAKQECWTKFVYLNKDRLPGPQMPGSFVYSAYTDAFDRAYNLGMEAAKIEMLTAIVDTSDSNVECLDEKQTEPKFKVGDKVKDISRPHDGGIYKVDDIKKVSDGFIYHIQGLIGKSNVKESDLEPYTEPQEDNRNLSQETANCDGQFDTILKDGFRNHNRLQIAAMAMQALLSNPDYMKWRVVTTAKPSLDNLSRIVARNALRYADALVAEAHKPTQCLRLKPEDPHEYQL